MEILRLKYLKPEGAKQKNKTKARGELFASSCRKFDSRETHAELHHLFAFGKIVTDALMLHIKSWKNVLKRFSERWYNP